MPCYPLAGGDVFVNNGCQSHCREQASSFLHVPRNTTIHYSRPERDVAARSLCLSLSHTHTHTLGEEWCPHGGGRVGGEAQAGEDGCLTCVICRGNNKALSRMLRLVLSQPLHSASPQRSSAPFKPSLPFSIRICFGASAARDAFQKSTHVRWR